ncbi:hypothetical protein GCM10011609_57290 [Lentzea pudingi]|uniref:FtsK domain-containing protein n=1 Tax=Lentzea pudingi TaxID=1789439 RepID=A0ABQ2IHF9_9PSEU|nr:hypothetical protein [Lentzea pudingi]GGN10052.1 hypothetical protein GCM10011609_57290 [Lentzea pudingi]
MSVRGVTRAAVARVRVTLLGWLSSIGAVVDAVAAWWIERVLCSPAYLTASAKVRKIVGSVRDWRVWPVLAGWVRQAAWAVWRVAGPPVRDAAGWVRYRAPGVLWQGVCWLARRAPRWIWRATVYAFVGAWWVLSRTVRWASGHASYAGLVKQMDDDQRHGTAKRLREEWARMAAVRSVLVVIVAVVVALVVAGVADKIGNLTAAGTVFGVFALVGRGVRPRPAGDDDLGLEIVHSGPDEPFPIADAHTRAEAADAVSRALKTEGVDLRLVGEAVRQGWGWEVPVILRRGTPSQVVDKLAALETTLDLPAGGAMASPDRSRRARVVLRLAERDPFTGLQAASAHAVRPLVSRSITDRLQVGSVITGEPLALGLLGVHGVVIGDTGSGKSSTLCTLADAVTDCADAVVWDLDPAGTGLDVLADSIERSERTRAGIEDALADALALAEVRPHLLRDMGMPGREWVPSPEHPAVIVFVDEYPRLSNAAKDMAVDILRIGRKARVSLLLASTEATSDTLGDAIADTTALKILHACRHADVRLVLGPSMLGEGWRPDRLNPASADSPEDAGKAYVYAPHYRDPVLSKFRPVSDEDTANRARDRAPHRPRVDAVSIEAARKRRHSNESGTTAGKGSGRHRAVLALPSPRSGEPAVLDRMAIGDVLAAFGDDERLWTVDLLARLANRHDRYAQWAPEDLADALRPLGLSPAQIRQDGRKPAGLPPPGRQ